MKRTRSILLTLLCAVLTITACDEQSVAPANNNSSSMFGNNYPNSRSPKWRDATWTYHVQNHLFKTTDIVQARIGKEVRLKNGELADTWIYSV